MARILAEKTPAFNSKSVLRLPATDDERRADFSPGNGFGLAFPHDARRPPVKKFFAGTRSRLSIPFIPFSS